ncbi:universal stress protein [Pandoraea terrae]|uniref:Universal stress protein n=1 Tax=Pandoraea terrae TaxID=1537710 RepID=A0A5E4RXK2_9BURK|nr:universal stress protein [Pandoraea terrae]VVD67164.1 universal stress protein [Pandoraea terrae]
MYERILVSIDGSNPSNRAIDEAVKLVGLSHGRIRLVSVVPSLANVYAAGAYSGFVPVESEGTFEQETNEILARAQADLKQRGIEAETKLISLDSGTHEIADVVLHEAQDWGADVIVLGTHGRRGVTRLLLGSVAETLLRITTVPLLLVKAGDT